MGGIRNRGGNFFECVLRKSSGGFSPDPVDFSGSVDRRKDGAFGQWVASQLDDDSSAGLFPEQIAYRFKRAMPPPTAPLTGTNGAAAVPYASYVYLDVGAWIGGQDQPWGKLPVDGTSSLRPGLKRDFGIICGPHVLLCSFAYATPNMPEDSAFTALKSQNKGVAVPALVALLQALGQTPHGLGKPIVSRYLAASPENVAWARDEKDWAIHVIVGDTHIPLLDDVSQSHADKADSIQTSSVATDAIDHIEQDSDYGDSGGVGMSVPTVYTPPPNIHQRGQPRTRRWGRIDLGPIEQLVQGLVGATDHKALDKILKLVLPIAKSSKGVKWGVGVPAGIATAPITLPLVGVAFDAWQTFNDALGVSLDSMTVDQAISWYEYYKNGSPKGVPPADIFETAGQHFLDLANGLAAYRKTSGSLPVRFHQLGDMLDFWIGFTCHYIPSSANDQPVEPTRGEADPNTSSYGSDFVMHWTHNCLSRTAQGRMVAEALDVLPTLGLPPAYLYGNHDNYLGGGLQPTYTRKSVAELDLAVRQGSPLPAEKMLPKRRPNYDADGLFMEHGHQWEEANADNAETMWLASPLIGTPSPKGEFVTQAAFIRPAPIRDFNGAAVGALTRLENPDTPASELYGGRLTQLAYSADRFMERPFYAYVMGHTHSACLSRVFVRTDADLPYIDLIRRDRPLSQVRLRIDSHNFNVPTTGVSVWPGPDSTADGTVDVSWEGMIALMHHDWVSLDDPEQAVDGARRKGLWKWVGVGGQPNGGTRFHHVPAGHYVLKGYLDALDQKVWQRGGELFVMGVSIEAVPTTSLDDGDATATQGTQFFFSGDGKGAQFENKVVFRWALNGQPSADEPLWLGLFRKGTLPTLSKGVGYEAIQQNDLVEKTAIQHALARNFLTNMSSAHPTYGRWPLDADFQRILTKNTGVGQTTHWELRCFLQEIPIESLPSKKTKSRQVGPTLPFALTRRK